MSGAGAATWKPAANPWLIALVVTMAAFMEVLDTTIVNVALPYVAGTLAASNDESTWVLTSYLVANGIVLTIAGWLSDTIGRKRYFLICIAAFTVCSLLCGLSQSLGQLVVFRLLQGFFGGGLQPNQQAIILDTFPPEKRGPAFAITAIATIVAPVLGPTLGGYIVEHSTWRWIFLVNVPVGALAFFLNAAMVQDPPWEREKQKRKRSIDFIGLSLIVLGLGCLQIVLDRGEDDDWFGSKFIVVMAVLTFIGIFGAICWLVSARRPIIDLDVFKDRNFAMGSVLIGAMGAILYASAVLIPQFSQSQLGYTALLSGLILSPGGIVVIILIPFVGQIQKVVQTRFIVMFGFFFMGCALMYSATLNPQIDYGTLVLMRSLQTAALGFLFVPISTITYLTLPQRYRSDGAALFSMFRNVGGSIGISISTALVTQRRQADQAQLQTNLNDLHQGYTTFLNQVEGGLRALGRAPSTIRQDATGFVYQTYVAQAAVLAYADVFLYAAVVAFAVVPLCLIISGKKATGGGGGGE